MLLWDSQSECLLRSWKKHCVEKQMVGKNPPRYDRPCQISNTLCTLEQLGSRHPKQFFFFYLSCVIPIILYSLHDFRDVWTETLAQCHPMQLSLYYASISLAWAQQQASLSLPLPCFQLTIQANKKERSLLDQHNGQSVQKVQEKKRAAAASSSELMDCKFHRDSVSPHIHDINHYLRPELKWGLFFWTLCLFQSLITACH